MKTKIIAVLQSEQSGLIFLFAFSLLALLFLSVIFVPSLIKKHAFSPVVEAQSVPPHAGILRGGQGWWYCDNGYHLVSFHMNVGNTNNAFYLQCNSNN